MSDRSMRSCFPAWRHAGDEEDEVALVPSPPHEEKKDTDGGDPAVGGRCGSHQRQQSTAGSLKRPPWWSVPTRGVGLVAGGLVVLALLLATTTSWWTHLDYSSLSVVGGSGSGSEQRRPPHHAPSPAGNRTPIPLSCVGNAPSCRALSPTSERGPAPPPECPEYFRHIHSDLRPWRETGITREAVESGRGRAAFRLLLVGGRAYVETYHRVFQTRDTLTQWGIAQLLARYPGRVPDLDLMFNCEDMPEVRAADYLPAPPPPPLFRYCKDAATLDIVFPDWSFWGWPELNIRPWAPLLEEMAREARRLPWPQREPYAHWKGNPGVSPARADLLRCNSTEWNARVFRQDWGAAVRAGFRGSNLARQCRWRYKIFVQGRSWSVSQKYILACDSPTLLVDTPFRDFFSRGLVAGRHYWPIDPARMCASIKFAVDWGNAHPAQARRMAAEGSAFAREDLAMDYVYDYMLHLLTEYAKLLRYKPTVPENAVELCPEALACSARGRHREFMEESRERYVADYEPCTLPPPFTDRQLREMARTEDQVRARVNKMMMTMAR